MSALEKLLDIMAQLRDPDDGCPWDLQQDFHSIAPYTIEEAYEVADAIDREDMADLQEELGDLLLQVVFHAQMARESGAFDFDAIAQAISDKMIRRHPHVFSDEPARSAAAQQGAWEGHKKSERAAKGRDSGALAGVSIALPALLRASKLGKRAAGVGFDWPDTDGVRTKVDEELAELDVARRNGDDAGIREEVGDLLFAVANLARHLGIEPEESLRASNRKFTDRFAALELRLVDQNRAWDTLSLEEMEAEWQAVKAAERHRS